MLLEREAYNLECLEVPLWDTVEESGMRQSSVSVGGEASS